MRTKTIKEAIDEILRQKKAISDAEETLKKMEQEFIDDFCPIKIGERVISNSYPKGKLFEVQRLWLFDKGWGGKRNYYFRASGSLVNKDGSLHKSHDASWEQDAL